NQITTSITKPHIFNLESSSGLYSNLWDGDMTHRNTDKPVKKTIYDPSPPEFTVPRRNFATGFSIPGSSTSGEDRMYLAFDSGEEGYYYKNGHNVGVYVRRSTSDTKGYLIFAQCLVGSGNGAFYGEHNHSHLGYYWTVAKSTYNEANYLYFNIDPSTAKNPFVRPTLSGNLMNGRTIIAAKEE
ncbi:MAG: hypothetical protein IKI67_07405, partial [Bacteroidales bacterium]|nr:hypothetical protein [Bacteroidales bacterium]